MAHFELELPDEIIADINKIYFNTDKIFGGMTRAGAKAVRERVIANLPSGMRGSNILKCMKLTRTYKTPSDGGINTKVGFYGYFTNKNGQRVPAPLVCNMFEYGSSKRKSGVQTRPPKEPFFRKSFNKDLIERTMLDEQSRLSGGLLDDK